MPSGHAVARGAQFHLLSVILQRWQDRQCRRCAFRRASGVELSTPCPPPVYCKRGTGDSTQGFPSPSWCAAQGLLLVITSPRNYPPTVNSDLVTEKLNHQPLQQEAVFSMSYVWTRTYPYLTVFSLTPAYVTIDHHQDNILLYPWLPTVLLWGMWTPSANVRPLWHCTFVYILYARLCQLGSPCTSYHLRAFY